MAEMAVSEFAPREDQRRLLEVFQADGYRITSTAACDKAGVNRRTFYHWYENQGFRDWWQAAAEQYFITRLPKVYGRLLDGAAGTFDPSAPKPIPAMAKLFLDRFDKAFVPKKEVTGNSDVNLSLKSDAALQALCDAVVERVPQGTGGERPVAQEGDSSPES